MKTTEAARSPASGAATLDVRTMHALVYHGPGQRAWEVAPRPVLRDPTDAIVRITTTTICGTDLHILKGDVPSVAPGRILGHEGIGVIEAIGAAVTNFHPGDRVLISCITSCARCDYCRKGAYSHCRSGGWVLGHLIDGTQAEFVRIPFADTSLYPLPPAADEDALVMLSDILPTAYECGVINGQVKPGDSVAIVGAGPIGLAALLTAQFVTPSQVIVIDVDPRRLDVAKKLGATTVIDSRDGSAATRVLALTNNEGVDVAMEAVGVPATFELCQAIVAPCGRIANIGVHGSPVTLHLEQLWDRNIAVTTRLVDTVTTPTLLKMAQSGKLPLRGLTTHTFKLGDVMAAYDTFSHAATEGALKVILKN